MGGAVLDFIGRNMLTFALVNITGFGVLIVTAYVVGWYKSHPWRGPKPARYTPRAPQGEGAAEASRVNARRELAEAKPK